MGRADVMSWFNTTIRDNIVTAGVEVVGAFLDNEANLPTVIVPLPEQEGSRMYFGLNSLRNKDGSIEIQVISDDIKELADLVDDVEQAIFNNQSTAPVQNISLGSSTPAPIEVGGVWAQVYVMPFEFKKQG